MSETLVIEWDRDRLIAAVGSISGSSVQVRASVAVSREEGISTVIELGEKLKTALSSANISATEAIVVFPRHQVTFNRVELPNLSDDEIPDMVRMQAATRLTVPVESVGLDFVPLPVTPGAETRDVLLVTLPQKHVDDVHKALAVAGLEVSGIRISSFGIAEAVVNAGLLSRNVDTKAVEAVISLGSDSIEMIFMTGHSVAFSHSGASWSSLDGIEQAVRAEVSRARLAAAEDIGEYSVRRLTVIGSPDVSAKVPDSITKRLNDAEVVRLDPDGTLVNGTLAEGLAASDVVAVVGAIANAQKASVDAVDLVNPRQTPEKKDYGRLKTILIAGIAALLLAGGWKWRTDKVSALNGEATALADEAADMKDAYKLGKNDLLLDERLTEWKDRDISWLDELKKIQEIMGSTERVFIREFKFSLRKGDYVASFDAEGYAKSSRDVEDLMRVLTDAGYEVAATPIQQNPRDPNYPTELILEVSIPTPKKESAAKQKKA
ncbi:MAG: pilus assembly protein PilM [Fuerstiella sp.]|nr:pilus assembly protein PilM [Fuerstiella sp.]